MPGKSITENLKSGLFCGTAVLPAAVAFCVCSPFGAGFAFTAAMLFSILTAFTGFVPSYASFAVIASLAAVSGVLPALIAVALAMVLFFAVRRFAKGEPVFNAESAGIAAVMLGTALALTVMQTTDYFGIGAVGNNVLEMLTSYRSLGFHGNWRGVLYGTITMVLMITYPRKMKILSKKVPATFWAILFTTVLTFFLNPVKENTAINEIGAYRLFDFSSLTLSADLRGIFNAFLCGIALFFIMLYREYTGKEKSVYYGSGRVQDKLITSAVSISVCLIALLPLSFFAERIPVHSLAVIIIVGMWQRVNWHALKVTFTGGLPSIVLFAAVLAVTVIVSPEYGIILAELWALAGIKKAK